VDLKHDQVGLVRALPLLLEYCYTRVASGVEAGWIVRRLEQLCAPFGTRVEIREGMIEFRTRL
jgi:hypothetical protein